MSRWLVKLEGTASDLEDYPYWFPHGQVFATNDSDGTYVVGELLEACTDATAVYEATQTVLVEMHAVICLLDPGIRRPTIGVVLREDDTGKRTGTAFLSATIGGRSKVSATLSVNGAAPRLPEATQAQLLLKAAQTSRHLRVALSLLALPHVSWHHLYRALEEIEAYLGKKVHDAGMCSSNERERFTRSANSGEIAGIDARHRVGKYAPPAQPMTLPDAQSFLRCCLDATLRNVASAA
jgi:hypothetical protein